MERAWYLKVKRGDVAPHAILVGDPARLTLFKERLISVQVVGRDREFTTLTGRYETTPVSVVSTGIGAPASAIVLEELAGLGVRAVVRAGTMMAVTAELGTFILAHAACRYEGTSRTYLPLEFPAVADPDLFAEFRKVLDGRRKPYTAGIVGTCDGFYTQMMPTPDRTPGLIDQFTKWKLAGADMETSAIYTIARSLGMRAVSLCTVTVDGRTQKMLEPSAREGLERELVELTLQGVHTFAEWEAGHGDS